MKPYSINYTNDSFSASEEKNGNKTLPFFFTALISLAPNDEIISVVYRENQK